MIFIIFPYSLQGVLAFAESPQTLRGAKNSSVLPITFLGVSKKSGEKVFQICQ